MNFFSVFVKVDDFEQEKRTTRLTVDGQFEDFNQVHLGESDLEFGNDEEEINDNEVIKMKPPTGRVVATTASSQVWSPPPRISQWNSLDSVYCCDFAWNCLV
jgi:hypothetical protein